MGRLKKDPRLLKHQIGLFISDEERYRLRHMAKTWGVTASQMFGILINRAYEQGSYLQGYDDLSQDERQDLIYQREHVLAVTGNRAQSARQRNLERRNGLDRGLTNVMVVIAPQKQNLPGVFCHNLGQVWVIPYGILYKVKSTSLIPYQCFASVFDYFIGRRILPSHIASFIGKHRDYVLSSFGEKAVLTRLFAVYGNLNLSLQQSREIAQDTERAYERERVNRQLAKEYGFSAPTPNPSNKEVSSLLSQIKDSANVQINEQLKQDEDAGIDTEIDTYHGPADEDEKHEFGLDDADEFSASDFDTLNDNQTLDEISKGAFNDDAVSASAKNANSVKAINDITHAVVTAPTNVGTIDANKDSDTNINAIPNSKGKGRGKGRGASDNSRIGNISNIKKDDIKADTIQSDMLLAKLEPLKAMTTTDDFAMAARSTSNLTQWGSTKEQDESNFVTRNKEREALGRWEAGIFVPYENVDPSRYYKSPSSLLGEDENDIPELPEDAPDISSALEIKSVLDTLPLDSMDRYFNRKERQHQVKQRHSDTDKIDFSNIDPYTSLRCEEEPPIPLKVLKVQPSELPKVFDPFDPFDYYESYADWLPHGDKTDEMGIVASSNASDKNATPASDSSNESYVAKNSSSEKTTDLVYLSEVANNANIVGSVLVQNSAPDQTRGQSSTQITNSLVYGSVQAHRSPTIVGGRLESYDSQGSMLISTNSSLNTKKPRRKRALRSTKATK